MSRENLPHYKPENYDALKRAVAVAQWNLGSESWAHLILNAYFDPEDEDAAEAIEELEAQAAS